jgi:hypothetical protein
MDPNGAGTRAAYLHSSVIPGSKSWAATVTADRGRRVAARICADHEQHANEDRREELLQRTVIRRAHEDVVHLDVHGHLCPDFHPLRVGAERGPCRISRGAVLVRQQID